MKPKTLAKKIAQLAHTKKAQQVTIMDLRKLTDITDYFVICSGESDTQVKAITDAIIKGTEKIGSKPWHSEGISQKQWVLLDYVDVVTHIFHRDSRNFYNIEKIWGDAPTELIEDKQKKLVTTKKKKLVRPK